MFSAFSLGKVIKTILPGSILSGGLILLVEGIWQWKVVEGGSLVVKLADKEWLTTITAALIPISLILGFLLNTFVWLLLNRRVRSEVDAKLSGTAFPEIRRKLSGELWEKISQHLGDSSRGLKQLGYPSRESLEYFYLPVVSLDDLNYLWESYFSWYEFQINTACAIALSTPFVIFLLWMRIYEKDQAIFLISALGLLVVVFLLCWALWHAARENLIEYEKDLMLLIVGSLSATSKPSMSAAEG